MAEEKKETPKLESENSEDDSKKKGVIGTVDPRLVRRLERAAKPADKDTKLGKKQE